MWAWIIVSVLCLMGCGTTEPSEVPVGQAFDLAVSKTQAVNGGLRVTFLRVSDDSRCPTDVVCVWAGDAALQVRVEASRSEPITGVLHTSKPDEPILAAGFELRVRGLRPAPVSTRPIDPKDYVATLVVTETK